MTYKFWCLLTNKMLFILLHCEFDITTSLCLSLSCLNKKFLPKFHEEFPVQPICKKESASFLDYWHNGTAYSCTFKKWFLKSDQPSRNPKLCSANFHGMVINNFWSYLKFDLLKSRATALLAFSLCTTRIFNSII